MKKNNEKLIIFILFFVQFTHMLDFVIMMPLGPKLMRAFEMDSQKFSILVSSYTFSAAISGLISSFFVDKFDRKKVLLFFYTGFLLANVICALSVNYAMLVFARFVAGGFGGVLVGLVFSILGDTIPEQRRGAATGVVMSAFGTASVIGIPLGLFLADSFDWHSPFWLISILSLLVIFVVSTKLPKMIEHISVNKIKQESSFHHITEIIREKNYRNALITTICYMTSGFLVIPFVSQYLVRNAGLLETDLRYTYFFGGLTTLITSRLIGKMADRFGKHKVLYVIGPLSIIPIFMITNLNNVGFMTTILTSTLFFVLVSGRFVPLMSIITSSVKKRSRGSFMAINSSLQQMSMGFASFLGGVIIKNDLEGKLVNYNYVGYFAIFLTFIFILLASRVKIYSGDE